MTMLIKRVIRKVKEKEIWPNLYGTVSEAGTAIEAYVNYHNQERIVQLPCAKSIMKFQLKCRNSPPSR